MKEDVWTIARDAGVSSVVADASEWAGQDFDLVVDYAGFDTTQKALLAVRRGGTVVQVGLGRPTFTVLTPTLLGRRLVGSLGGTVEDIAEVFDLMAQGEISPVYEEIAFEEIARGLERLKAHEVTGRLVAGFGN